MNTEKIRRWCDKDSTVIRMHIYVIKRECMQANTQIKFETTITDTHTLRPIFLLKNAQIHGMYDNDSATIACGYS